MDTAVDEATELINNPVEETSETLEQMIDELSKQVSSLQADVSELLANKTPSHPVYNADANINTEPERINVSHKANLFDDNMDPYMYEKPPIRRHRLFKRVFGE